MESQALKISEHVVKIDEFAVAECLTDARGGSMGPVEEALALEEEVVLLVRRSALAPFVGGKDSQQGWSEWVHLQCGGREAKGFEGA